MTSSNSAYRGIKKGKRKGKAEGKGGKGGRRGRRKGEEEEGNSCRSCSCSEEEEGGPRINGSKRTKDVPDGEGTLFSSSPSIGVALRACRGQLRP